VVQLPRRINHDIIESVMANTFGNVEYTNCRDGQAELQYRLNRYYFAAKFVRNKVVLDCACNDGFGTRYLKDQKAKTVVGVDISENALNYAREMHSTKGMLYVQADATKCLSFRDNYFDVIVSFETIEHLEGYRKFLRECARTLNEKGVFICSTPNKFRDILPYGKWGYTSHAQEFSPKQFCKLIKESFLDVELYYQPTSLKDRFLGLGVRGLYLIPGGFHIKQFIKKAVLRRPTPTAARMSVPEHQLDKKYEVRRNKFFSVLPRRMIVVAKNKKVETVTDKSAASGNDSSTK
jgi:2-polyprenyl-3-methyl-5-hydroxy-6-metoxy-1,4-benzoquinol methylase